MAAPNLDRAREQVAAACGRLAEERLVVGTAGNVSARAGDHVAISATGAVLADATPELVSVIDMDGRVVEGELAPTSELDLHLGVYRRYDAGAVVHTHAPMATALSCVLEEELYDDGIAVNALSPNRGVATAHAQAAVPGWPSEPEETMAEAALYLCTADRPDLADFLTACIEGGVDVVQLRDQVLDARALMVRAEVAIGRQNTAKEIVAIDGLERGAFRLNRK